MGKLAAAGYLQRLRELRGISRAAVARAASTSDQNIFRIEVDGQEPRAEMLAAFVHAIDADIADVYQLLISSDATRADGEHRAEERFHMVQQGEEDVQTGEHPSTHTPSSPADELIDIRQRLTRVEEELHRLQLQLPSPAPAADHPPALEPPSAHTEHDPD